MADATTSVAAGAGDGAALEALAPIPAEFVADKPMTPEQNAALEAFRKRVVDVAVAPEDVEYWKSEHALKRFLVARNFKVDAAVHMYSETMAFRISKGCGTLLQRYTEPLALRRYFPWGIVGQDREGFPVLVERVGAIDLIGINSAVGMGDFLDWVCYYHEVQERIMRRISAKMGRDRHKMTCIIDMGGLSLRHMSSGTLNVLKARTRLEEDNYPEVVKRVFIVNTPAMFSTVWGVVKMFMDEGTADKIQLLGSNFMPTLLKYVDADVIPKFLGGNLLDSAGDPECRSMISPGGVLPPAFTVGVATDGHGCGEEVHIGSGKHHDVYIRVPASATVHWRWGTLDKDINFSVSAVEVDAGAPTPVGALDVTRSVYGVHQLAADYTRHTATHGATNRPITVVSAGSLTAPLSGGKPGAPVVEVVHTGRHDKLAGSFTPSTCTLLRLRWDNTYSWIASKTLVRRIDVLLATPIADAARGGAGTTATTGIEAALVESEPVLEAAERLRRLHYESFGL